MFLTSIYPTLFKFKNIKRSIEQWSSMKWGTSVLRGLPWLSAYMSGYIIMYDCTDNKHTN